MAEPTTPIVLQALNEIAVDLELPQDQIDLFVEHLGRVVWSAWYPLAAGRSSGTVDVLQVVANLERIGRGVNQLKKELDAGPAEKWLELRWGSGFAEYSAKLADLLSLVHHLRELAGPSKRARGGQPANQRACPDYYMVAEQVCRAAVAAGVTLTTNKNNIEEGDLPKVLYRLSSLLPEGLVPKHGDELSASALDRIRREVDAESHRAA